MNQLERSTRAVREARLRRRKARQTRQPRHRRLVVEALEDRRLLALQVLAVPLVGANPDLPHPTHEVAPITLKAMVRGAATGQQCRVTWDTDADGDFSDETYQTYTVDSFGGIWDIGRTFTTPTVTQDTFVPISVKVQNLSTSETAYTNYSLLIHDFQPSGDPRNWTDPQLAIMKSMAFEEVLWNLHRNLQRSGSSTSGISGYLPPANSFTDASPNALNLFVGTGHMPAYPPGTYTGTTPSADWLAKNDFRWNSDPYAETALRLANYLAGQMAQITVDAAAEADDGRTPIALTNDLKGYYAVRDSGLGDGGQNAYSGATLAAISNLLPALGGTTVQAGIGSGKSWEFVAQQLVDGLSYRQNRGGSLDGSWYYDSPYSDVNMESSDWAMFGLVPAERLATSFGVIVNNRVKFSLANNLKNSQLAGSGVKRFPLWGYNTPSSYLTGGAIGAARWLDFDSFSATDGTTSFLPYSTYTRGQLRQVYDGYMNYAATNWTVANQIDLGWSDGLWQTGDYLCGDTTHAYGAPKTGLTYTIFWYDWGLRTGDPAVSLVGTHDWKREFATYLIRAQDRATAAYSTFGRLDDAATPAYNVLSDWDTTGIWSTALAGLVLSPSLNSYDPTAVFSSNWTTVPQGQWVTFDASDSYHNLPNRSITSYAWDFDASNGLNWNTPNASGMATAWLFATPGTYTVTLRVADNGSPVGTSLATRVINVVARPENAPAANSGGPYTVQTGASLSLSGSGTDPNLVWGDVLTFAWDLDNDGAFDDATVASPTVSAAALQSFGLNAVGLYPIRLKATDSTGRSDIATTTLTVYGHKPQAVMEGSENVALGSAATFDGHFSTGRRADSRIAAHQWDFGDGVTAYGKTVTHVYDAPGSYTASLTVTDDLGGTDTISQPVVVIDTGANLPPQAKLDPVTGTWGNALTLDGSRSLDPDSASGGHIVQFAWDLNRDGTFDVVSTDPTAAVPWATVLATGPALTDPRTSSPTGTVVLRVTDDRGATDTATASLSLFGSNPVAIIDANGSMPTRFDASRSYARNVTVLSYAWDYDYTGTFDFDAAGQSPTYAYGPGLHTAALRVTDQGTGATSIATLQINGPTVTAPRADAGGSYVLPAPVADVRAPITLDATGSLAPDAPYDALVSYEWDTDGDGLFGADDTNGAPWSGVKDLVGAKPTFGPSPNNWPPGLTREIAVRVKNRAGAADVSVTLVTAATGTNDALVTLATVSQDSGVLASGAITRDNTLRITGAASGSVVTILLNGSSIGTAAVSNGSWSFTTPALPNAKGLILSATTVAAGRTVASRPFLVSVDSSPPVITLPANELNPTIEATSPSGASFAVHPTVSDNLDPSPLLIVAPAISTFPLGTTNQAFTAVDWASNVNARANSIQVRDTTPPTLRTSNVTVEATSPSGVISVPSFAQAFDFADTDPVLVLTNWPSGGLPVGQTALNFRAFDDLGNSANANLMATVLPQDAPQISSVSPSLAAGTLASDTTAIQFTFDQHVVDGWDESNYELRRAGSDCLLGTADDLLIPLTVAYTNKVATLSFSSLADDVYRLTVKDTLTDVAGNSLDGDANGTAGGNWVRDFAVRTLSATLDGSGNLTITDTDANGKDNQLTVKLYHDGVNDFVEVTATNELFLAMPSTTPTSTLTNGDRTLRVPLAAVTGSLVLHGAGGDDTLIVDFSGGNPIPGAGLDYNGGPGADNLHVQAQGAATVFAFTRTAGAGSVSVGGRAIRFSGVEPNTVTLSGTSTTQLDLTGGDTITFTAVSATRSRAAGLTNAVEFDNPGTQLVVNARDAGGYTLRFSDLADNFNPTAGIDINGHDGGDAVEIVDLGDTFGHGSTGVLDVDLGAGTDSVTFKTNGQSLASLAVAAETIAQQAGATLTVSGTTTLDAGTANDVSLGENNDFATITVTAARSLNLKDVNTIDLGAVTLSGGLGVNAGGEITDSGRIVVPYPSYAGLNAAAGTDIILDTPTNDLWTVAAVARNVTLVDATGLVLNTPSDTAWITGDLNVTAGGDITQTGWGLRVNGAATFVTKKDGGAKILVTTDNRFGGSLTAKSLNAAGTALDGGEVRLGDTAGTMDIALMQSHGRINLYPSGDISIPGPNTIQGTGDVNIRPASPVTIGIGEGAVGVLNLDATDLAGIQAGHGMVSIDYGSVVDVNASTFHASYVQISGQSLSVTGLNAPGAQVYLETSAGPLTDGGDAATDITAASVVLRTHSTTAGPLGASGDSISLDTGSLWADTSASSSHQYLSLTGTVCPAPWGLNAGTGTVFLDGGTIDAANPDVIYNTTELSLNGTTLALGTSDETVAGLTLVAGSITGAAGRKLVSSTDFALQSGSVSVILDGSVNLVKSTGGTVTLTGANTYTGTTTIDGGTLLVNGSIGGTTTVQTAGTLGGTGAAGTVISGGTVAPGDSPGTLDTGSVTFQDNSFYNVEIGGATPGDGAGHYDQLNVNGSVTIGANVTLSLSAFAGYVPQWGDEYVIIANDDTVVGTFAGLDEGTVLSDFLGSGHAAVITYAYPGGMGHHVALRVNRPPVAEAGGAYSVNEGGSVQLNASGTTDPDRPADALTYEWDFDLDRQYDDATGVAPTFSAALLDGPGSVTVGLRVTDACGETSFDTATVDVTNVPPTASLVTFTGTKLEGTEITVTGSATDPAGVNDTLTYAWQVFKGAETTAFASDSGVSQTSFSFTPNDNADWTVKLTVSDEDHGTSTTVSQVIAVANVAPTASLVTFTGTKLEGTEITVTGSATDPAGINDTLTYAWQVFKGAETTAFASGSGVSQTSFSFTPNDNADWTVKLTVSDEDHGTSTTVSQVIVVANVAPTASLVTFTGTKLEGTEITVTGSATDPAGSQDTLTYAWQVFKGAETTAFASASGVSQTSFSFTPNDNADWTVKLTVSDEDHGTSTTVSQVIVVANVAPTASLVTFTGTKLEGTEITVTGSATDPAGVNDTLTYAWQVFKGAETTAFASGSGVSQTSFSFTPNDNADWTVKLTVSDEDHGTSTTISQVIAVANVAPTASLVTFTGTKLEGTEITVTGSATDPAGSQDTLTYAWQVFKGAETTAFASGSGVDQTSFSFTPDDNGNWTVKLTVSDEDPGTSTTVSQVIVVANVAPTASLVTFTGTKLEGTEITVTGSATDPAGVNDTLTYAWQVFKGAETTAFASGSGVSQTSFSFTPNDNADWTVKLTVSDEDPGTSTTISQVIAVANVAPTASLVTFTGTKLEGTEITVTGSATDPAGSQDTLTYAWQVFKGAETTAFASGSGVDQTSFSFTPDDNGNWTVKLTVSDEDHGTSTTVSQVIAVANVAPTASLVTFTGTKLEGTEITVTGSATDPAGSQDTLTYAWQVFKGAETMAFDSGSGVGQTSFSFTPDDNANWTVTLTVSDEDGGTSTTVSQVIAVANVAPTASLVTFTGTKLEGTAITVTGSATDPAGINDTLTHAWQVFKGAESTAFASGSGVDQTSFSFTPNDNADYTVTLTVSDEDHGTSTTVSQVIAVANVAPVLTAAGNQAANEGIAFSQSGSFADPGADTWSATVDYGDGTGVQPLPLNGKDFTLNHVYADNGTCTVTVRIRDDDMSAGAWVESFFDVFLANVPPTASISGPDTGTVGVPLALTGSATDPSPMDVAGGLQWLDVVAGDFNGDGRADVVGRTDSGVWWVAKSEGTQFVNEAWGCWSPIAWLDVQVADVNGDGRDDVVGRSESGHWWVASANSAGTGFVNEYWGYWSPITWLDVRLADVTGDGRPDVVGRTATGQWWVGRSTGTGFVNESWGTWSPGAWLDVHVRDMTGDGRADILGRNTQGQWWLERSTGTGFVDIPWGYWSPIAWRDVDMRDVNGDGLIEMVGRTEQGAWWVTRLEGSRLINEWWGYWSPITWWDVYVRDVTGDGRADVVGRADGGGWWVGRSTGSGFVNEPWGYWSPTVWSDVQVADLNGADGSPASSKQDVLGRAHNGQWWVGRSDGSQFSNEYWGQWSTGLTFAWTVTRDGHPYTAGTGASFTFAPALAGTYEVTLRAADKDDVGLPVTHTITVGSPLLAAQVGQAFQPDTANLEKLTYSALAPVIEQAIGLWQAAGLDAAHVAALRQVPVSIADLPGTQLGLASSNVVLLDTNAAGVGWDTSADLELSPGSGISTLDSRLSLLTAVLHEFGHMLGLADLGGAPDESDVMFEWLAPGACRLPTWADVDAVLAGW